MSEYYEETFGRGYLQLVLRKRFTHQKESNIILQKALYGFFLSNIFAYSRTIVLWLFRVESGEKLV